MSANPANLLSVTDEDIVRNCGETFTRRGRSYIQQNRVIDIEWLEEEQTLNGKVSGQAALPYVQRIESDGQFIDGNCSCPVGYNCKHVAAVLLQWQIQLHGNTPAHHEDAALEQWRNKLVRLAHNRPEQTDSPLKPGQDLMLYQIDSGRQYNHQPGINVSLFRVRVRKNGTPGKESPYYYHTSYHLPRWVNQVDREITQMLQASRDHLSQHPYSLEGVLAIPTLQRLIDSGRCYAGPQRDQPLAIGEAREIEIDWQQDESSGLWIIRSALLADHRQILITPSPAPWYLDTGQHLAGPISNLSNGALVTELLRAPPMRTEQAQETTNFIALHLPDEPLPLPVKPDFTALSVSPEPVLLLRSLNTARVSPHRIADYYASIMFRYGDFRLAFDGSDAPVEKTDDQGRMVVINRDLNSELDYLVSFNKLCPAFIPADDVDPGLFSSSDRLPRPRPEQAAIKAWSELLGNLEALEHSGWQIIRHASFDLAFEQATDLHADVERSAHGWFDLSLNLKDGDHHWPLLPLVSDWLELGEPDRPMMVQASGGTWLEIPAAVLQPVVDTLYELYDAGHDDEKLRIPAHHARLINTFEQHYEQRGVAVQWLGNRDLRELAHKMANARHLPPLKTPGNLNATLRDYQCYGLSWMQFLRELGFNGILADDMGLGKTLQTLAHLLLEFNEGRMQQPALVVAPTSVLSNWQREAARFTPALKSLVLHGADRKQDFHRIGQYQLVITSYQLLLRDFDELDRHQWHYLILDEAQLIKNPKAKITQAAKNMQVERRLCLTGTPMENHLGELWSLFDFLMPGFLGTQKRFTQTYRTPIEKNRDETARQRLNNMISPFLLRRRKEQVATELPPKTEIVREVELGPQQTRLYESIRISMEQRIRSIIRNKGFSRSHIEILDALLKLRQTCCHPQLVKLDSAGQVYESAKTQLLVDMLEELVAENKRVLVFSQFTQMLLLIEKELDHHGIDYVKLTGATRNRDAVVDKFQLGKVPVFLISLKAGGTGLNLTAADTVIHYDPWWNPAVENQASDRAHRIGQDKPVFVYRLVSRGTVEEKIVAMQAMKQRIADSTVNRDQAADPFKSLNEQELLSLFAEQA